MTLDTRVHSSEFTHITPQDCNGIQNNSRTLPLPKLELFLQVHMNMVETREWTQSISSSSSIHNSPSKIEANGP